MAFRWNGTVVLCIVGLILVGTGKGQAALPDPLLFDFRPKALSEGQEDALGYIVESGTAYSAREYGLMYGFVNREGKPVTAPGSTKERAGTFPVQRRTFYKFSTGGEAWQVKLPVGRYKIVVTVGDSAKGAQGQGVGINGKPLFLGVETREGSSGYKWSTTVVTDTEGMLKVRASVRTKLQVFKIFKVSECRPFPSNFNGKRISDLPCNAVTVSVPHRTRAAEDRTISISDSKGAKTGFTMVLPSSRFSRHYRPELIKAKNGEVTVTPTRGTWFGTENSVVNALGVGCPVPDMSLRVLATLGIPYSSGETMYGCVYSAISDRTFVTICLKTESNGTNIIEARYEENDQTKQVMTTRALNLGVGAARKITLGVQLIPQSNTVQLLYTRGSPKDGLQPAGIFATQDKLFSKDAAGQDIKLETQTFAGIWFSGPSSVRYTVSRFNVLGVERTGEATDGKEDFNVDWTLCCTDNPTTVTVCKDGKVYVGHAFGELVVYEIDRSARSIVSRNKFFPVGKRLILGVECDPDSRPGNMALWLSHTDVRQAKATANSGIISKVSGPTFDVRVDKVTGLPRSKSNHANYQIRFGPDGKMYLGMGSNTAAGAANFGENDFSKRPEQPLSASILRMDVRNPSFRGDCTPSQSVEDLDGTMVAEPGIPSTCDVELFATGLRSTYDFTWINGAMYGMDNGVGDGGYVPYIDNTYKPGDSCAAPVVEEQAKLTYSGRREDLLHKIVQGGYYGYPNPSRRECVFQGGRPSAQRSSSVPRSHSFGGGSFFMDWTRYPVGIQPHSNFRKALFSFGSSVSPNGIIQYKGQSFCGILTGSILVTYFAQLDRIQVLELDASGDSVIKERPLRRSTTYTGGEQIRNPLALAQDRTGLIFVAEFYGSKVRVFDPIGPKCWQTETLPSSLPEGRSQAAYVQVYDDIYIFGGVTAKGVVRSLVRYNVIRDKWKSLEDNPGAKAVRKAAMVHVNGELYMIGGTGVKGKPIRQVKSYNVETRTYKQRRNMKLPVGVSGAVAESESNVIILAGGKLNNGTISRDILLMPLARAPKDRKWLPLTSMSRARMDAMGKVVRGTLYICGGRNARGKAIRHCDKIDLRTKKAMPMAKMPAARYGGSMVVVDHTPDKRRLVVIGGYGKDRNLIPTVYQYHIRKDVWKEVSQMPQPKAFAAVARFSTGTYIIGGTSNAVRTASTTEVFNYL